MNVNELKKKALEIHKEYQGKISVESKIKINRDNLQLLYTPGVAWPSLEINKNKELVYDYCSTGNMIAIVTDGSAVLGLGNIGSFAALPVMEGKAILFKAFGNVDAFPICLATQDTEEIIKIVKNISPSFGGINLEDISSPRCFEIERRLIEELDIPVFHDDQHGTAIVVLAGLINALKLSNRKIDEAKVIVNGAGAAGIAITKFLVDYGIGDVILCDTQGAIYQGRNKGMNPEKEKIALQTNKEQIKGLLEDVIKDRNVFLGVSVANILTKEMIQKMEDDPIIFAMANPTPEIMPEEAKEAGARLLATGRSDYPNQINNVLAFPGVMRGALDVRARRITEDMKYAAAFALADLIPENDLSEDKFIPSVDNLQVGKVVAGAVAKAAVENKVAGIKGVEAKF
ncbi:NADP-dependent malic enzyme [bacterium]|nr:NADP-dependent malic enzyme [bacterium]